MPHSAASLRWRLFVFILSTLLLSVSMGMNAVLFPLRMLEELKFPEHWIGIVLAAEIAAALVVCLSLVYLVRYAGLFICLLLAIAVRWVALYYLADAAQLAMWLVLVLAHGLGAYLTLIVIQVLVTSLPVTSGRLIVFALFGISISIGFAAGPPLLEFCRDSGFLNVELPAYLVVLPVNKAGFAMSMLLSGLAGLIVLVSGVLRKSPMTGEQSGHILEIVKRAPQPMWAIACAGVAIFGISAFITVYGINNGLTALEASLLLTAFMVGSISLDGLFAWIISVMKLKDTLVLTIFVGMICSFFLPIAVYDSRTASGLDLSGSGAEFDIHFWLTALLLFVWGGVNASTYSQAMSTIADQFTGDELVAANAAFSFMDTAGGVFGVLAIGFSMRLAESEGLPYIIALVSIAYFSYALTQRRII